MMIGRAIVNALLRLRAAEPPPPARLSTNWTDGDLDVLCDIAEACSTEDALCEAANLLGVMWVESRGAHANAMNPHSSATGLIQWMGQKDSKGVLRYSGLTRKAFSELGVTGQLPHVRTWFLRHRGHLTTPARVYTAVFLPAFVKQSVDPNFVLAAADSSSKTLRDAYVWNKYFDNQGNKDGKIQVWELENAIQKELAAGGARCEEIFERLAAAEARRHPCAPPEDIA